MTEKTNQITLTAEQLVNIVGHAATQEQLDNVRRELDAKSDKIHTDLSNQIALVRAESNQRYEKLDAKIESTAKELRKELKDDIRKLDNRLWWIAGLIVALAFKSEILAFLG